MKTKYFIFIATILLSIYTNTLFAKDITIQTNQGNITTLQNPTKIAVLGIGALDDINLLGIKNVAVPTKIFIPKLENAYKLAPKIGTFFHIDYEALIKYQPNIIIIGPRTVKNIPQLNEIAQTINLSIDFNDFLNSAINNMRILGKITNKENKAEDIIKRLKNKFNFIHQLDKKGKAIIIVTSGGKISIFGEKSRFGFIYKEFGFQPATHLINDGPHGMPVSNEFIKSLNPKWLFVFDRDAAIGNVGKSAKELLDNDLIRKTDAWKNKQILYLEPAIYISIYGLGTLENIADKLINILK